MQTYLVRGKARGMLFVSVRRTMAHLCVCVLLSQLHNARLFMAQSIDAQRDIH